MPCRPYPLGRHTYAIGYAALLAKNLKTKALIRRVLVEVKVVRRSCHELPCVQESLYQQTVQLRGGIEVIALARVRGVGRVSRGQF